VDSISYQSLPELSEPVMVARGNTNETVNDLPPAKGTPPQPPPPAPRSNAPLPRVLSEPQLQPKPLPEGDAEDPNAEPTMKERSTENPIYDPDDDRSTADYRAHLLESIPQLPPVKTKPRVNGLLLATIGASALFVVLLLIYWLGSDPNPVNTDAPPPVLPKPVKTVPKKDDPPTPTKGDGPDSLTSVKFVAPPGTYITHDGKQYPANTVVKLYPGTFTYGYRCPAKKKGDARTVNATAQITAPGKELEIIELCK
jgi:hypothetical protein